MKKLEGIMEMVCENNTYLIKDAEVIELARVIARNAFYAGKKSSGQEFTLQQYEKDLKDYLEEEF